MGIEFDWHDAEDERWHHEEDKTDWSGQHAHPQPPPSVPGRKPKGHTIAAWRMSDGGLLRTVGYLGLGVLIGTLISGAIIYYVAQRNQDMARADLQAVISAEARALAAGDEEIFLSLQDDNQAWQEVQRYQLEERDEPTSPSELVLDDFVLLNDVAWATVGYEQDGTAYQRMQFYHLVDGQWRRTAPDPAFWGEEKSLETRNVRFVYRARDEALVQQLSQLAEDAYSRTALDFNVGTSPHLTVYVDPEPQPNSPLITQGEYHLASPHLTGVRADGQLPMAFSQKVIYSIILRLALEKSSDQAGGNAERIAIGPNWVVMHGVVYWQLDRLLPDNTAVPGLEARLNEAGSNGELMPLSSLWPPYRYGNLRRSALALAEAHSMVSYLADTTDPGRIPILLRAMGETTSPSETLAALGLNFRQFEQAWRAYTLTP
jgi:hypothetical protein